VSNRASVLGAVLAGGQGQRLGGSKAGVRLNRRPLIEYPLEALWRALGNVVVVAKGDTELPPLPGVSVWVEPDEPRHPLTGVIHALSLAQGRPVLICACDLPLVTPDLVRALAAKDPGPAAAVIACAGERLQPLLACYHAAALEPLASALAEPGVSVRGALGTLESCRYQVPDEELLFNVNTPAELLVASTALRQRRARTGQRISRT
jgi:molybdopterin-guanine dinucleotide biosynthesis protein A